MENLLKPDFGVLLLTVCNFLLLVYLLKKFAWGPVINALEKRENQIKQDKQTAADARESAEELKKELDQRLAQISNEAAQKMAAAVKAGEAQKEQLLMQTQEQVSRMLTQAQAQIQAEKEKALADVRGEIANLSVLAASRVVEKDLKEDAADQIVAQVLKQVQQKK
ncbi:MAG: F0F1 ATP synthase subunit B [Elusimicrobiaceae bacterium]|nr:F0F1 ATP synthase subunit B [Elusimicrobiaceae bacterium]